MTTEENIILDKEKTKDIHNALVIILKSNNNLIELPDTFDAKYIKYIEEDDKIIFEDRHCERINSEEVVEILQYLI